MNRVIPAGLVGLVLLLAGCVADSSNLWDYKEVSVDSRLNISFDPVDGQFVRTMAKNNRNEVGWVEQGSWQAETEAGTAEAWVFVASLFTRAFKKDNMPSMPDLARQVSGSSYVDKYYQDQINTNSGPIDYIYYRASGQPCVLIRKYWSDPLVSSDASRAIALQWVAGTNLIRAYYCKPSGNRLNRDDLNFLARGISVTGLYWPENMFQDSSQQY